MLVKKLGKKLNTFKNLDPKNLIKVKQKKVNFGIEKKNMAFNKTFKNDPRNHLDVL